MVLNPEAGSAADGIVLREALDRLPEVRIRPTRRAGDARIFAREAARSGAERVVAAGGDGTVNEVVNGLMDASRPVTLGVLPLGTANDFARSLALPEELERAVDVLVTGRTRRIDVVETRGSRPRHLVNVAAGGFGGRVQERVDSGRKRILGPLEYVRSAAEELPELEPYDLRMTADGETVEASVYSVVVANGSRSGGNVAVAPEARMDDGLLDVVLISALDPPELLLLLPKILLGKHLDDEGVLYRQAAVVSFHARPPMPFSGDGEPLGEEPLEFRVRPAALEVACPSEGRND